MKKGTMKRKVMLKLLFVLAAVPILAAGCVMPPSPGTDTQKADGRKAGATVAFTPARQTDNRAAEDFRKLAAVFYSDGTGITQKEFEAISGLKGTNEAYKGGILEGYAYDYHYPDGSVITICDTGNPYGNSAGFESVDRALFADTGLSDSFMFEGEHTYDDYVAMLGQDGVLYYVDYSSRLYLWVSGSGKRLEGCFSNETGLEALDYNYLR